MYVGLVLTAIVAGYMIFDKFIAPDTVGEIGILSGTLLLDQTIPNVDESGNISFSDYQGSALIIDFMAPGCIPCITQIHILKEVESIDGVEVISINIDPRYDMEFLMNFRVELGIKWFFGHSPSSALDFEVAGIPTILVVDQQGQIVYRRARITYIKDFERILPALID